MSQENKVFTIKDSEITEKFPSLKDMRQVALRDYNDLLEAYIRYYIKTLGVSINDLELVMEITPNGWKYSLQEKESK